MAPRVALVRAEYRCRVHTYGVSLWHWAQLQQVLAGATTIVLDGTAPAPDTFLVRNQFYNDVVYVNYAPGMTAVDFSRANFFELDDDSAPCGCGGARKMH
jgi:hypothetical protein